MRELNQQELADILCGCTYLGCGGGGSYPEGLERVRQDLAAGLRFRLMSIDEMADEDYAASPYSLGSTAPLSPEQISRYAALPRIQQEPTEASFKLLERHLGKNFVAVMATEMGPGNTASALSAAAHLGIAILDADLVGRSTPEVDQNSILLAGISIVPAAVVSRFGDELILEKVARPSRQEAILRSIAVASQNVIGVTDSAIPGKIARRPGVLVPGSIRRAASLGRAYRQALVARGDPMEAVLRAGDGCRLFEGRIEDFQWRDEAGFLVGEIVLSGTDAYRGSRYRIWYKNEHLISWQDGQPSVTAPDLITLVAKETGRAIANPDFERAQEVSVIGFPAPSIWRTGEGLKAFGPEHFGYHLPYTPIEDRCRRS